MQSGTATGSGAMLGPGPGPGSSTASTEDPHGPFLDRPSMMRRSVLSQQSFASSQHTYMTGAHSSVNFITFNQDASCIAMGLFNGYKVFRCDPSLSPCFSYDRKQSIGIVEMLFGTALIALVALGEEPYSSPRKLVLLNAKRNTTVCDLVFPSTILTVRLVPLRLLVMLECEIYLYDVSTMALIHTLETSSNPQGLCAVSASKPHPASAAPASTNLYLAYPSPPKTITHDSLLNTGVNTNGGPGAASNNVLLVSNAPNRLGDVIIFDLAQLMPVCVIEAHKSAIAAMAFSMDATLLATASDKGTIVRVFDVESGTKLFQFRRGTYSTHIYSLAFSNDNKFILATSSSGTVHVFRLGATEALQSNYRAKNLAESHELPGALPETRASNLAENPSPSQPLAGISRGPLNSRINSIIEEHENLTDFLDGDDSDAINESDVEDEDEEEEEEDDEGVDDGNDCGSVNEDGGRKDNDDGANARPASSPSAHPVSSTTNVAAPIIDKNRSLMARLIRRLSQRLGRKAAQKMGDFLPSRFSLILEPTRHFASLKINLQSPNVKSIARMSGDLSADQVPLQYFDKNHDHTNHNTHNTVNKVPADAFPGQDMRACSLLHINVVTSDGIFYVYGLDPVRGGDCILLSQRSLLDDNK